MSIPLIEFTGVYVYLWKQNTRGSKVDGDAAGLYVLEDQFQDGSSSRELPLSRIADNSEVEEICRVA